MNDAERLDGSPLTLYLSYDYLPALQQAALVGTLGRIYEMLLWLSARNATNLVWGQAPWERELTFRLMLGPPLTIASANTGESITFKFDVKGHWLPRFQYPDGDLKVLIPRWTAVAVLVGAAVTFGLGRYKEFLDIQKNDLEIEKLRIEIEQMKLQDVNQEPRIQMFIHEFLFVVGTPNIKEATVNGVSVFH